MGSWEQLECKDDKKAKNKEYKIYPSCYSTIIHLRWYCSTMPKKITILQV